MDIPPSLPGFEFLSDEEAQLLEAVANGNEWLRAVLCTLARRGVAYRQAAPDKAREILRTLAPLPYYKGGQFLFDLMEWEDFMLDGPPPPIVPTTLDARSLSRLAGLLRAIQQQLDGERSSEGAGRTAGDDSVVDDDNLPPLEPGLYLYQDVVLGIVASVLRSRPGPVAPEEPEGPPQAALLRLTLDPPQAEVTPGEQDLMQVVVDNRQKNEERVRLSVDGLPAGWYTLPTDELTIAAGDSSAYMLLLNPPRTSASEARTYPFSVTATSTLAPERVASVTSVLIIQPFSSLFVEVRP
ncbi:MAG: hypothetical protein ACOC9X_02065 [bacterium]